MRLRLEKVFNTKGCNNTDNRLFPLMIFAETILIPDYSLAIALLNP